MRSNFSQRFGQQSQDLKQLNDIYQPIFAAGPNQGIGGAELANLNTQAGQNVGQNYAKASQSLAGKIAQQGGGNEYLPSGAQNTLKQQMASSAASDLSGEQSKIAQYSQDTGRQLWSQAGAGLNALSGEYGANQLAGEATTAGNSAYGEAQQNAMQGYQQFGAIAGGISELAKSAASFTPVGAAANAAKGGIDTFGGG
jgi:hypothetical protein